MEIIMNSKNWVLYGAYGYTGRIIIEEALKEGESPVLAGRNPQKLIPLAEAVGLDYLIFDLTNSKVIQEKIKGFESELYYLGRMLARSTRFQSNDRTITQLKFSGSLRLIRNENAADSIIAYQKLVDYILMNQEDDRIERRSADPLLAKIFNAFVFDKMLDEFNNVNKPAGNPPLRSYDPSLQQDLAFIINQLKGSNIIISTRLNLLNEKAKNTIEFLKKEYRLE